MLGLGLVRSSPVPAWWQPDARFAIDFTTGLGMQDGICRPLSELITFERASSRLAVDGIGRWRGFAANVPAITDLGLSLEPAATNLVADNTGETVTTLVGTTASPWTEGDCPLVGGTARRLTQGSGSADGFFRRIALTGGAIHTASRFYKYDGSARWVRVSISDNVAHGFFCYLDLQTMTLGSSGAFGSAVLTNVSLTPTWNNWSRIAISGTVPNTVANAGFYSHVVQGDGNTNRMAGTHGLWADQVEAANQASSPIISTGTGASRNDDVLYTLVGMSDVFIRYREAGANWETTTHSDTSPFPLTQFVLQQVVSP